MRNVNCCLCGSDNYRVMFTGNSADTVLEAKHIAARRGSVNKEYSYTWVRCKNCGLVYANPIPDIGIIESLYKSSDQGCYSQEIENISRTYEKYLYKYKKYILNRGTALDVGAGNGFFLKSLLNFGFEIVRGIEPSLTTCNGAPDDIKPFLINDTFDEKYFKAGSIDLISCFQTLEHVYRPDKIIEGFSKLLSKNGIVYCIVHNFGAMAVKVLGAKHPIVTAGHITLFDLNTLNKMFSKYFDVLEVFSVSNRYSLRYWISLLPFSEPLKTSVLKVCATARIDKVPLTMSLGNIGLIARKR